MIVPSRAVQLCSIDLTIGAIRPQLAQCLLENSKSLGFPVGTFAANASGAEDFDVEQLLLVQLLWVSEFSPARTGEEFKCAVPARKSTSTTNPTTANDWTLLSER